MCAYNDDIDTTTTHIAAFQTRIRVYNLFSTRHQSNCWESDVSRVEYKEMCQDHTPATIEWGV